MYTNISNYFELIQFSDYVTVLACRGISLHTKQAFSGYVFDETMT